MDLAAARLVCAAKGLDQLAHVWQAMDRCVDYSARWTLERAAAGGLKFLVQHLALSLSPEQLEQQGSALVMDFAASNGHLDILAWLHATASLNGCSTRAMDDAAKNGHLPIARWLHEHRSEGCTARAMDYAAGNGHLHVVRWLHEHRIEGCTTRAMDLAAQSGHLHVLKWLHEHRSEGCTPSAVNYASSEGHLDVVRWLCSIRNETCTETAMVNAARGGHIAILEYLGAHFPGLFDTVGPKMMHAAIANGQAEVLTWLIAALPMRSLKCEEANGSWMDVAAQYGHVSILRWFHDHCTELPMGVDGGRPACTVDVIEKAASNGHTHVLSYLYENDLVSLTDEVGAVKALVAAVNGGHRECVEWLVSHYEELYKSATSPTVVMDAAAGAGHVEILQYLREAPSTTSWQTSAKAVNEAARQGFLAVLRWLQANGPGSAEGETADLRWTPTALEMAATNGHLSVVQWIAKHHGDECASVEAFNAAAYMDHVDILAFLYAHLRASCSVDQALEHAVEGGAEDAPQWLEQLQ
jgi:ankyrin repeat protein